jgi:hypothetical protein
LTAAITPGGMIREIAYQMLRRAVHAPFVVGHTRTKEAHFAP